MTDLVVTAASVVKGADAVTVTKIALAAITAGQVVYLASTGQVGLHDANSATAEVRVPYGLALNSAAANQPVTIQTDGELTMGATLGIGIVYLASPTPGGIMPSADAVNGDTINVLGVGKSASVLKMKLFASGITKA